MVANNYDAPWIWSGFIIALLVWGFAVPLVQPVSTDIHDFFLPGSQPNESGNFISAETCNNCHGAEAEPYENWLGSMMAMSMKDPIFLASMVIANQDAPESGDLCIRCHSPVGWLEGRSTPTNGSMLNGIDLEGVQCHFCHKMIKPSQSGNPYPDDPDYVLSPGNELSTFGHDTTYLNQLTSIPEFHGNGMYVVDDQDNRRGPYFDPQSNHSTPYSPFHEESEMCGTCHDVSNPVFSAVRNDSGTIIRYIPNPFGSASISFNPYDLFPIERTYSEWLMSDYNSENGISGTPFGGNKTSVGSCQDCHMQAITGKGCSKNFAPIRNDLPMHDLTGGNTFAPLMVHALDPLNTNPEAIQDGIERARFMLQNAASLELKVDRSSHRVTVRVINNTGHKLPTGYPEGRRMWIYVKAIHSASQDTFESGTYDALTAVLNKVGTKIYEVKPGISDSLAQTIMRTAGPSFHFVLNDSIYFDNRIPPRGFTNDGFLQVQAQPVGYHYADGQYWDSTVYNLPFIPDYVEVALYYQTISKEYIEFLRDESSPHPISNQVYQLWDSLGKSPPEIMNFESWTAEANYWLGTEDSLWNNPNNWSDGIPSASDVVIIHGTSAYMPHVLSEGECLDLTIERSAHLIVHSMASLIVHGILETEAPELMTMIPAGRLLVETGGNLIAGDIEP